MRKLISILGEMIMWGCVSFTGAVGIYMANVMLQVYRWPITPQDRDWGHNTHWEVFMSTKVSGGLIVQLLGLCMCISILQYVFFSGKVLQKPSYLTRMLLFGVLCFGICVLLAVKCKWFWLDHIEHWVKFVGIFLAAYVGIALLFELSFRIQGIRYNEALGRHQKRGGRPVE